jgi:hypothetical protein
MSATELAARAQRWHRLVAEVDKPVAQLIGAAPELAGMLAWLIVGVEQGLPTGTPGALRTTRVARAARYCHGRYSSSSRTTRVARAALQ